MILSGSFCGPNNEFTIKGFPLNAYILEAGILELNPFASNKMSALSKE
jgi:hypothetical protein